MTEEAVSKHGGCHCGAVRFTVEGALRDVVNCHCAQCTKTHGHFAAYAQAITDHIDIDGAEQITWYQASEEARRGFCRVCGSQLFWQRFGDDTTCIAGGAFDQPSGLRTIGHIYIADKPDYYDIGDDLPKFPSWSEDILSAWKD